MFSLFRLKNEGVVINESPRYRSTFIKMQRMAGHKSFIILLSLLLLQLFIVTCLAGERTIQRNPDNVGKRVALVVGNAQYRVGSLNNPVNDAVDMAALLTELNFEVLLKTDADRREMKSAINSFATQLEDAEIGLFYYAGHGMQVDGVNYLIPSDADVRSESDIEYEAIRAGRVLGKMREAGTKLNIVILDACRNNPFQRSFRSSRLGLAKMDAPMGTIIAYATSPGSVAADGNSQNGLYTGYLLKNIARPGMKVQDVFNTTGMDVMRASGKQQIPWMSSTPVPAFYLAGPGTAVGAAQQPVSPPAAAGSLLVKTDPSGAKVWIDQGYEGRSPVMIHSMSAGLVTVRAGGKAGYQNAEEKIRIRPGHSSELVLSLSRLKKKGYLYVYTEPRDARVRILHIGSGYEDGMQLNEGAYELEVSMQGYATEKRNIVVHANKNLRLKISLQRKPGSGPQPGDIWKEPVTGMEFVFIKGGCYGMGDSSGAGKSDEKPVHEVCVDDFWMGKYEVTQEEYQKVTGSNPSGFRNGSRYPVEQVSWNDSSAFAETLSRQSSRMFRLPTEAEWEYAARSGGKKRIYAAGNDVSRVAWFSGNSSSKTHPVGRRRINSLGLYDLSGNVWEWCSDWYDDRYYASSPRNNPQGGSGSLRVYRGGSWSSFPWNVRTTYRNWLEPGSRSNDLGIRLVFTENPVK